MALPPDLASILSTLAQFAPSQGQHPSLAPSQSSDEKPAPPPPSGPIIDPATITEWTAGLRCVTKLTATDPNFGPSIKNMINNQRRNEHDWYSRRQELKREQSQRASGSGELDSIMRSIGATSVVVEQSRSEEELKAELDAFDAKIHRAQMQMNAAMTAELKTLGVPFFGTHPEILVSGSTEEIPAQRPKWSPPIGQIQLRGLQQRMISYLEDMYKD